MSNAARAIQFRVNAYPTTECTRMRLWRATRGHRLMGRKSLKNKKAKIVPVREPSNRPSRAADELGRQYGPAEVRRLRDAAVKGLRDPEWGTELGQIYLERKITAEMYGAGKWWRDMAARYATAINAPPASPKALSLDRGSMGTDIDPESEEGAKRASRDRTAVRDFLEAHAVLLGAGVISERYVRDLCEHDHRPFGAYAMEATTRGLQWLADWRGLTSRGKSA